MCKKSIIGDLYRIQWNDSIICGHVCIGIVYFNGKWQNYLDFANLLSHNEYKKLKNNAEIFSISWNKKHFL